MVIITGNSKTKYSMNIKGDAKDIEINIGNTAIKAATDTAVQELINTASKVIESGGDIITAPAVWLKDIQQNWITYMVVTAIILSILAFFCYSFCFYFNRKKNSSFNNNLIELAKIINNKGDTLKQPLPLSMLNLPSVSSNTRRIKSLNENHNFNEQCFILL
jgi:hypothetical protein